MADFLTALDSQVLLTDGAMGSYLFELTGRLSEANHVYESFNADRPELIRQVHLAYLGAGARCLKSNTFGANRHQLRQSGLEARVAELNHAGVHIARDAIAKFKVTRGETDDFFVLGSIGPAAATDWKECYREQVASLIGAGVDALLLETFDSLPQLEALIELIHGQVPVIAEMTIRSASPPGVAFVERMAQLGVAVAGVNCCAPWDATAFVDAVKESPRVRAGQLRLVVMPNAGGFQRIGNRFMTSVNPEFVGKLARQLMDSGVRLIGGCCEMHPPHILEMHNYLQSRQVADKQVSVGFASALPPVGDGAKQPNGPFSRKLKDGQFVVSVEMLPPRGTDDKLLKSRVEFVGRLAASGLADALDVTDGSRGIPLMTPGDFIHLLSATKQLEFIPHFTGRDLNVMGVQSRLIGYHANGIHNVLFITGDPPKMSPTYPRSTAVFDLDSVAMIRLTHSCLNAGVDFGGTPLGKQADPRCHFTIGTGFEPEALDQKRELTRLAEKLDHGVDYVMTQPAFRSEALCGLEKFRARRPFLVGVMVLTSFDHAQRMTQVPGVVLPEQILQRLAAMPNVADQAKVGQEIAAEQIRWIKREGWAGLYLMSPASTAGILPVLQAGLS